MNTTRNQRLLRAFMGSVLPVALLLVAVLPMLWLRERLPDPLATHWGAHGEPNGAMRIHMTITFAMVIVGLPAVGFAWLARRRSLARGEGARGFAIAAFVATMGTASSWMITLRNLDADSWQQAGAFHPASALTLVILGLGAAIIAARLGSGIESAQVNPADVPSAGIAPGARAYWQGTARALWATAGVIAIGAAVILLACMQIMGLAGPGSAHLLPFGIVGLAMMFFTSIRMTADRNGVRIAYGAMGWPTQRIALAEIQRASVLQVNPLMHGGWGYRGSLKAFRRASIVLRRGEGVQLDLTGGRSLVITIDGATQAAGVINDLLARSAAR